MVNISVNRPESNGRKNVGVSVLHSERNVNCNSTINTACERAILFNRCSSHSYPKHENYEDEK